MIALAFVTTTDVRSLPLDRSFAARMLASIDPGVFDLEVTGEGSRRLTLEPHRETLEMRASGICLLVTLRRFDAEVLADAREFTAVLIPREAYCEPTRAERAYDRMVTALRPSFRAALAADDIDIAWDAVGLEASWKPGQPECREWTEADRTVLSRGVDGLLSFATTPVVELETLYRPSTDPFADPSPYLTARDAYRIGEETLRLIEADGDAEGVERVLAMSDVLLTRSLQDASLNLEVQTLVVWEPDPERPGLWAALTLDAVALPPSIAWAKGTDAALLRATTLRRCASPSGPLPIAAWLLEGLREQRWTDPSTRPPIVAELKGWVALVALVRGAAAGEITEAEARGGVAQLLDDGAALDPDGPDELRRAGLVIGTPRAEAEATGFRLP